MPGPGAWIADPPPAALQAHRGRSLKAQSLASLLKVLASLAGFLDRAFPGSGGGGSSSSAAAAATAAAGSGSEERPGGSGGPLLAQRCAWPPQAARGSAASGEAVSAAAMHLLGALYACWAECNPAHLATQPEAEPLQALLHILRCTNVLVERLRLLPAQASGAGAAAGWAGASVEAAAQAALAEQLAEVVLPRLLPHYPAYAPVVRPGAALQEALVQYNLQVGRGWAACGCCGRCGPRLGAVGAVGAVALWALWAVRWRCTMHCCAVPADGPCSRPWCRGGRVRRLLAATAAGTR
jgi:hypothetical protein